MTVIERTVDGNQVVVTFEAEDRFDSVVWGMISHNQVPRVAAASRSTIDATTVVRYDVSMAVPLVALADRPLRREQVLALVSGVLETLLEADRYMIDQHQFLVTREHLYVDPSSCEPMLLCIPVRDRKGDDVATVLRDLLLQLWIDREEDRAYVAELVGVLTTASSSDLAGVARAVKNIEAPRQRVASPFGEHPAEGAGGGADAARGSHPAEAAGAYAAALPAPVGYGYAVPGVSQGAPAHAPVAAPAPQPGGLVAPGEKKMSIIYLLQHYSRENKEIYDRQRQARAATETVASHERPAAPNGAGRVPSVAGSAIGELNGPGGAATPFEHTVHVDRGGVRAQLGVAQQGGGPTVGQRAHVRRLSTGEVIPLVQAVMVIGRRRTRVDIAISGDTVSKNHAAIIWGAQGWSITDNGSTNGVEIGGERIAPLTPVALSVGDQIGIGDEVLVFGLDA